MHHISQATAYWCTAAFEHYDGLQAQMFYASLIQCIHLRLRDHDTCLQGLCGGPLGRPVGTRHPGMRVTQNGVDRFVMLGDIAASQRRDRRLHQTLAPLRHLPCAASYKLSQQWHTMP